MVTMMCCGERFATVQESIDEHPLDATTCAATRLESDSDESADMTDADVTADLDELSRADVGSDAWVDEIMTLIDLDGLKCVECGITGGHSRFCSTDDLS